jgi:hypothetical protein
MRGLMTETLVVPRADFDMEEPWNTPAACSPVRMRRAIDGSVPRLATSVAAWYDAQYLTVLFSAADDYQRATNYEHDSPLYEEDVVEIFITPAELTRYYELEVSPKGVVFDATVDSPHGSRETMHVDRAWDCAGLIVAIRTVVESNGGMTVDTLVRIPFASLARTTPAEGELWRANFFRVDRHDEEGDEYSAWQPTKREPADFHVPAAFGTLRFAT